MAEPSDKELGVGMTCFVVGPIGDRLAPMGTAAKLSYENAVQMWEKVFQPACEQFGLEPPVRADKISESGEIPEQIFKLLRDSDLVIADLSGGNANVMYELGLRHSRDKKTVQIGENERLPFDVTTIRTIKFVRTEAGLIDARDALIEAIRAALRGGGSPVTATRVWNEARTLEPAEIARVAELSSMSDDPLDVDDDERDGQLELLAAGEQSMGDLSGYLDDLSGQMVAIGNLAMEAAPGLQAADTFAAKLTITRQYAEDLKQPAEAMDLSSNAFLSAVEKIDAMMEILIEQLEAEPEAIEGDEVQGFLAAVTGLAENAEGASVNVADFQREVRGMRTWSKQLRQPAKSIEHSLNTVQRGNAIVVGWAERLRALPNWVEPTRLEDPTDRGDESDAS